MGPATLASATAILDGWDLIVRTNVARMTVSGMAFASPVYATVSPGFLVSIAEMLSVPTTAPVMENAWGDGASASLVLCLDH